MLKDELTGQILVPRAENYSGHVSIEIFENEAAKTAYETERTPANEPARSSLYVGTKLQEAKEAATSLGGMNMLDAEQVLLEKVLLAEIKLNPTLLLRTKWDEINFIQV